MACLEQGDYMKLFCHLNVMLALCFITFTVLDWFNPLMNFVENAVSSRLLIVFCVISVVIAVNYLIRIFRSGQDDG